MTALGWESSPSTSLTLARFRALPPATAGDHYPDSIPLCDHRQDYLVKGPSGQPIALFSMEPEEDPPLRQMFRHIDASYAQQYSVAASPQCAYAVVSAPRASGEMCEEFIRQMTTLASQLRPHQPDSGASISAAIERLATLFSQASRATERTAMGLFGELFFVHWAVRTHGIATARRLLEGWWTDPYEISDFVFDGKRMEIKATTCAARHHYLSAQQYDQRDGANLVSLLLVESPLHGKGLEDLAGDIRRWFSRDPKLLHRIDANIQTVLGPDASSRALPRYDMATADATLCAYDMSKIVAHPVRYQLDPDRSASALLDLGSMFLPPSQHRPRND